MTTRKLRTTETQHRNTVTLLMESLSKLGSAAHEATDLTTALEIEEAKRGLESVVDRLIEEAKASGEMDPDGYWTHW